VKSESFGEGKLKPFEAADIRFTAKGPVLYAMTLGKPAGTVHIKSLAGVGHVARVEIVGSPGALTFQQDGEGLHVTVPDGAAHDYGVALRIQGDNLT
jgi:alpha-L-fucosidase